MPTPPPRLLRRPARLGAGLLLVVGGAAVLGLAWWFPHEEAHVAAAPVLPPVEVATAARADIPVTATGLGTVQAFNTVTIRTQVDGQLQRVLFTEGQTVKAGDLLAEIDPRPFQAALDQAQGKVRQDEAALANARLNLTRDADLAAKQFASQQMLDNQKSTVAQLEATVVQDEASASKAETDLSYTRITSPIDGIAGIRLVDAGNIVHPTDANGLVVITQTKPISVLSTLPEDRLADVQAALRHGPVQVEARSADGSRSLGIGVLALVDNEIDQASGTLKLKSTFQNTDATLWPGQFVQLDVRLTVVEHALFVPAGAVQRGPDGTFVYVVADGDRVEAKPVTFGQIAQQRAIVLSGLTDGDRVVTAGQYRLAPGVHVDIRDQTDVGDKAAAPPATPKG